MNRIAILGGLIGGFGFFFLPILALKPNRLAPGTPFNLLEFQGDDRYLILFVLALLPMVLAFREDVGSRGWMLVGVGNLVMILTLVLPAMAGQGLLAEPEAYLGEGAMVRNPRIMPSGGLALGLVGAYVAVFAGVRDLTRAGVAGWVRGIGAWIGPVLALILMLNGTFDVYSILVEFYANGEALEQKFIEHLMFVIISLLVGFVVGVGLGLWASREARLAPVILYAVGIIQTIPSLALFGVLLVPMARLGDQAFLPTLAFFGASAVVAVLLGGAYVLLGGREPPRLRVLHMLLAALAAAVPLALATGVLVTFVFRLANVGFTSGNYPAAASSVGVLALVGIVLWAVGRWLLRPDAPLRRWVHRATALVFVGAFGALMVLFVQASGSSSLLGGVASVRELTIRDLGVSGIGVAPALVALTLYSLLPMVRNTYAGLNNVDNAIIDSGRGMGMTPRQRFFQIELPLAFPVIMAGVRNAGVALVGIGTVATVIGAGGLGDFVIQGIVNTSIDQILLGAVPAIALALVLDAVLRGMEGILTSPGIKQVQS
ncbi:MAG: ABC transporter permease [Trueperaceae bacterium]|nr:ABC transporter permease [Trueperaceae bacterium]